VTQAIHVVTKENQKYYGVSGAFSIYNISVARGKRSATNVWVRTGSADETDLLIAGSMVMHLKHYPLPNQMNIKHRHTSFTYFAIVGLSGFEW
jgi:hypothetical protein